MASESHTLVAAAVFFTMMITFWMGEFKVGAGFAGGAPNSPGKLRCWRFWAGGFVVVAARACPLGGTLSVVWARMELRVCGADFSMGITCV